MGREFLERKGRETIRDLISNYERKGARASGNYARKLNCEIEKLSDGWRFIIEGADYGQFMESGRGPTRGERRRVNGGGQLIKAIKQWVKDKGVNISPYAITAKIHREGYKGKEGIISDVINDRYLDEFYTEFVTGRFNEIYADFLKKL